MRVGVRAEGDPAVVRHVQPLVRVGRPGVRALRAGRERPQRRRRRGPQPERAVDVEPRAGLRRRVGDRVEVVARAGVHLAELGAHDRRPAAGGELGAQRVDEQPPLAVGGNLADAARAEPDEPERAAERPVPLRAGEHADRRRTDEPVALDVVADRAEDVVARGGERGRVRELASGHERERRVRRDPEQVLQPAAGDLLDDRRRGRRQREPGVLIPRRGEPVGGERSGQRTPDHEPEVPPAPHLREPGLDVARERLDHLDRVGRPVRERQVERLPQLLDRRLRPHRPIRHGGDVRGPERRGPLQDGPVVHGASLFRSRVAGTARLDSRRPCAPTGRRARREEWR